MMKRQELPPAIAEHLETPMTLDAAARRLAVVPTEEEVEETMELVRWFCRRYPTAKERFAYIRRKYAEWTRNPPAPIADLERPRFPPELREESGALFDDTRLDDIDPDKHATFVIARVLDRGTIRSVAALVRFYGLERVRDFFRRGGARQLSCRTVPLWRAFLNLSREECTPESSPQSRSPFWTD